MAYNFPPVNKIFDDLDKFRDYCRFEGKVFNEQDLYKEGTHSWEAYKKWQGFELSANNKKQLWVPAGFAHGFLVLSDYADFLYKCSEFYDPNDEYSLLWSDRDIGIDWPIEKPFLSEKDSSAKLFKEFF